MSIFSAAFAEDAVLTDFKGRAEEDTASLIPFKIISSSSTISKLYIMLLPLCDGKRYPENRVFCGNGAVRGAFAI